MTMYRIVPSNSFKRDLKAMMKRGYDLTPLEVVVDMIASGQKLPKSIRIAENAI